MKTFDDLDELHRKLLELTPEIFSVKIISQETHNAFNFTPAEAAEWLKRYGKTLVTSNEHTVLFTITNEKVYNLRVWRNVPQRVNLMEI